MTTEKLKELEDILFESLKKCNSGTSWEGVTEIAKVLIELEKLSRS